MNPVSTVAMLEIDGAVDRDGSAQLTVIERRTRIVVVTEPVDRDSYLIRARIIAVWVL